MASGTHQQPHVLLTEIGNSVTTNVMTDEQLQKAWALAYARIIWPTIGWTDGLKVATWIVQEAKS